MTADAPPDGLHHRERSGKSEPAAEQQTVIFFIFFFLGDGVEGWRKTHW